MKRRLLSILLLCCMVLTWLPVTASAAGESASAKGGDAVFTLSASSASCTDGHTGEIGGIASLDVDVSRWEAKKTITIRYGIRFRCTDTSCELYSEDFFLHTGEHTFTGVDGELCHKAFTGSFTDTFNAAYDTPSGESSKSFSVGLTLISDKGISETVYHAPLVKACTESYYSVQCWECTGCGYFFMQKDMSGAKLTSADVFFPPAGHDLKHVDAKAPTCIEKGTVEHWTCRRSDCGLYFGDAEGETELTAIETDAPFAPHTYDTGGVCTVCVVKAAAGVRAADAADTVWYDTMAGALAALTDGEQLTVNADCADTVTLDRTCTVEVKAGVTLACLAAAETGDFTVTVVNNGSIGSLTGYTGKVVLRSGSGMYGTVINQSENGTAGSFLYRDSTGRSCCFKTADGWLRPDDAAQSSLSNVTVAFVPFASLAITGENVTGGDGSYALTAHEGDTLALTAVTGSGSAAYRWYYENDPDTSLSEKAALTLENVRAGKRTVVCTASADGYSVTAALVLTVEGQKESQSLTAAISKSAVGIREKLLPLLSVGGVQENAAVTYYQMLGETPAPETDTVIGADFAFAETGEYKIYAYTTETDNYAATASAPVAITVTGHANHCYCGGTMGHTHEEAEWQAWDGKSAINYEQKWIQISDTGYRSFNVAYVYLTGNVSANLTVGPKQILYLCLNGYSFTCADASQPAIALQGEASLPAKLNLCDCGGTGTLGGSTASGGSIRVGAYADAALYSGTLTGNNISGDGGAVSVTGGNCSFTMYGGAISGNSASAGGGIYAATGSVTINGGVISNNHAANGGGICASSGAQFHLNGGEIRGNTATNEGGGVYCSSLYSQNGGRCEFYGGTISGNTAKRGGGAYVSVCYIGYRNCRITGNTAAEAGGGLYLVPFASEKIIYMGNVYGSSGTIAPYIYDNTVHSAQNNLYLSDPDTQIKFTARINTYADAKLGVYFTGITGNGASVLLNYLQVNTESSAKLYLDRIFCDNPEYGQLEMQNDNGYYNLYLLKTTPTFTVTFDPNGGTLNTGEESKLVQSDTPYGPLPTPTRAGYRFDGWFTAIDGGEKVEESTVMSAREAHTLYAHWTLLHEHCICGGDAAAGGHTEHTDAVFTAWDGKSAISYTNKTAYVYLSQNAAITGNLVVDGTTLYLCLSGHTFASNGTNKIQVKNGGRLVLCDCAGGGTIRGATKGWGGSCIYLYRSTLDIYGGKITGGKVSGSGGGGAVALDDSLCTVNMYGGEISGNNGKKYGGAFFLNNADKKGGTVNVYGGTIANNQAQNGGVLYSSCGGTVNLYGGTISGNKATSGDGGVINISGGTVTLSGAVITGNTASRYGGAVYLYNGVTATMTGGELRGNKAAKEGGAVHVYGTSTFNLSGGSITGNSSVDGGAIYLNREPSVLNMTGGVISGNTATGNGGGVYIYRSGSVCDLSGGTIEKNTAKAGGGIYIDPSNNGQLKLSGAPTVKNNTVSGTANNVYLPSGKTLTISAPMELGASVGVTAADTNYPVAFSNAYEENYETFFVSDDASAGVEYSTADQKLYLAVQQYGVTVAVDGEGTAAAEPQNAAAGTEITLTATPADGYHFSGWIANHPGVQIYQNKFTMPAGDVAIKAVFEAHSFTQEVADEQYLAAPADCDNDAVYYKSCSCGEKGSETFVQTGTALDHDFGAWTPNGDGTHTRVCSRDAGHTETGSCSGGTATCTAKAVCAECGGEYGELAAHDFSAERAGETYRQAEANCQSPAIYYKSCSVCGAAGTETFLFGDKDSANHVGGTEVRSAAEASCTAEGYTGDTCCKGCGAVLIPGAVIPAAETGAEPDAGPDTGTDTGRRGSGRCLWWWLLLLLLLILIVIGTIHYRKYRRKK